MKLLFWYKIKVEMGGKKGHRGHDQIRPRCTASWLSPFTLVKVVV